MDAVCRGRRWREKPYGGVDRARVKLWEASGIEGVDLHSLRHTFASVGAHVDGGRYAGHVSALLGHGYQSRAITERYITANPQALRPAADAIAGEVARLMGERGE
jgi:integrase